MKRIRDDVYMNLQLKRPFGCSRGESFGQSQIMGDGGCSNGSVGGGGNGVVGPAGIGTASGQKLTTNDALTYLKEVKDMFQDQREKYDMFLEVMKDFKAQRTDTAGVIVRVKELFKGHNNLIYGFNTFLPKGYEITLDEEEGPPKKAVEFVEAINFVNKIKNRFQNDERVYKSFLDILNMYRKEHKDISEVYNEVSSLFEDHSDLLEEFTKFLPDTSSTLLPSNLPFGRNCVHKPNERNCTSVRHMLVDKHRHWERVVTSHAEHDMSVDGPESNDETQIARVQKEQRKWGEKENRDRLNQNQDGQEPDVDKNRETNSQIIPEKRKPSWVVESSAHASFEENDTLNSMYSQGFIFCEKVKDTLGSSDDYQAFLKCLNIYSNGIIKKNDLQNLVSDLLGKYHDLMEEFNDYLERCENIDGLIAGVMSKKLQSSDAHVPRFLKAEEKDKDTKRECDGMKEKEKSKDKYMAKSIQELDLSDCQRCTPSYRLLPDDYPTHAASQRSELGAQVLNEQWVSVTSGSEDYSFKHMRRNQYEESLFRCEDDRFELDMLLESVSSTAKRTEDLLNGMNENKVESSIHIGDHFTAINLRCIERLYGDHGLDVLEILRKNPSVALPIILVRLKQKQEEWTRCRSDFNKVWAEIYSKNHYKSLDHRSFYFKQQDSKNLSTRSLVSEIKELKEQHQQKRQDDVVFAFSAGNRQRFVPHLEYEFLDGSIYEDLYKLVQYSCEEVCSTKEQFNKVMRLWNTFLEPALGVISHHESAGSSEDDEKHSRPASHSPVSNNAEAGASPAAESVTLSYAQPKLGSNGDSSIVRELENGDGLNKRDNSVELHHAFKDASELDKGQVDLYHHADRISHFNMQVLPFNSKKSTMLGAACNHGKAALGSTARCASISLVAGSAACEMQKAKAGIDSGPTSVGGIAAKSLLSANGFREGMKVSKYCCEESVGHSNAEKEEGEVSPICGFKECFIAYGNSTMQTISVGRHSGEGRLESGSGKDLCMEEAGAENDADDENSVSEPGDEASGSESAGDECSHDDEDDMEHDEADGKVESEGEAEGIPDSQFLAGDAPLAEVFLSSVKPLAKHVPENLLDKTRFSRIFYGNDDFYVLFRLHQVLYDRILSAKTNCIAAEMRRGIKDVVSADSFARFMSSLYDLLDGSADNAKFEDECRAIIGNQSYVLFTLDKLIYKLVKQLQTVATDDMDNKLLQLFEYEKSRKPGNSIDWVYYDNARFLLHEDNIYRLEFVSSVPLHLSIQLMENVSEKTDVLAVAMDPNFSAYLHDGFLSVFSGKKEPFGIILQRNKRKYSFLDESSALCAAMDGVKSFNGLECKVSCSSCKISYVLDTEDFFFRCKRKRRKSSSSPYLYQQHVQARVQRFHRFLMTASLS